jgi:hypothetical protein
MQFAIRKTLVLFMLAIGSLGIGLALTAGPSVVGLGQSAYAGEDGCDDDDCSTGTTSDSGGSPSGGVNTGGGGTAEPAGSNVPVLPIALGAAGAVAGGSLLVRRFAKQAD